MIKLKICEKSSIYRKTKTSIRELGRNRKAINVLQELIECIVTMEIEKKSLHGSGRKKVNWKKIIEYRPKGAILRAKCRWQNEGKNTSI